MFLFDAVLHVLSFCLNLVKVIFSCSRQMPALKMKTKPVPSCVSEGTLLCVCQESSKICKRKRIVTPQSHETHVEVTRACQNG